MDFDVAIIGAGPAGIQVAKYLSKNSNLTIALFEKGEDDFSQDIKNNDKNESSRDELIDKATNFLKVSKNLKRRVSPKFLQTDIYKKFVKTALDKDFLNNFFRADISGFGGNQKIWGAYVCEFSDNDLINNNLNKTDIKDHYRDLASEMPISGVYDDLGSYHGGDYALTPPPKTSKIVNFLLNNYKNSKPKNEFQVGISRLAVNTNLTGLDESECRHCGLCLSGCNFNSIYSSESEFWNLIKINNLRIFLNTEIINISKSQSGWSLSIRGTSTVITCRRVVLAAGAIGTAYLAATVLNRSIRTRLQHNPTAALAFLIPTKPSYEKNKFALSQLSFVTRTKHDDDPVLGNLYTAETIPPLYLAAALNAPLHISLPLVKLISRNIVISSLFFNSKYTDTYLDINPFKSRLYISGGFTRDFSRKLSKETKKIKRAFRKLGALPLPQKAKMGMPGSDAHYAGTVPLQKCNNGFYTNENFQLNGTHGIYIADSSLFVNLPEKHPTFTIMALARMVAKRIVFDLNNSR